MNTGQALRVLRVLRVLALLWLFVFLAELINLFPTARWPRKLIARARVIFL